MTIMISRSRICKTMLTIKIDNDEGHVEDICNYLREVISWLEKDFTSGEGWELTGSDIDDEKDYKE